MVSAIPSCLSVKSLVASREGRARAPLGLPGTMRTRSLLFILLYLFSDLLTNWGTAGWGRLRSPLSGPTRPSRPPFRAQPCPGTVGCLSPGKTWGTWEPAGP